MMTTTRALEQRIRRLAERSGHMVYQEGGVLVIVGDRVTLLRCVGDEPLDRDDEVIIVRWLLHATNHGARAKVVRPKDWPEVAAMVRSGDWRG